MLNLRFLIAQIIKGGENDYNAGLNLFALYKKMPAWED